MSLEDRLYLSVMPIEELRLLAAPLLKAANKAQKTLDDFKLPRDLVKKIREKIISEFNVFVTTCGTASN
jgi:hypothetical protein